MDTQTLQAKKLVEQMKAGYMPTEPERIWLAERLIAAIVAIRPEEVIPLRLAKNEVQHDIGAIADWCNVQHEKGII